MGLQKLEGTLIYTYSPIVIDIWTFVSVSVGCEEDVLWRYKVWLEDVESYDRRMDLGSLWDARNASALCGEF